MTDESQQQEVERIAAKIIALAEARNGQGQPYLVSALGIDLGEDLRTLKILTSKGLNDFILDRLSDKITLVRLGAHRNVTAIIEGAAASNSTTEGSILGKRDQKRRFHYRFWAAFSVPPKGEVRVLDPEDLTFDDVAESGVPDGKLAIGNDFIPPAEAENRDEQIKANISKWLEANALPEDRFLAPNRLPSLPAGAQIRNGGSLLDSLIAALDRKQLQTVSLPLDVVATLLRATQR